MNVEPEPDDGLGFYRGCLFAVPFSLLFWALIILVVVQWWH